MNSARSTAAASAVPIVMVFAGAVMLGLVLSAMGAGPVAVFGQLRKAYPDLAARAALPVGAAASFCCAAFLGKRLGKRLVAKPLTRAPRPQAVDAALDPLTGLPNRVVFRQAVDGVLTQATPAGLLILNLDRFRTLRHTQGTSRSDAALREFGCRLRSLAPPTAHLARLHGDEFAMLLPGIAGADLAREATVLQRGLAAPYDADGSQIPLSVSIGGAVLPDQGADYDSALGAALLAVQQAKSVGGGTWRMFDSTLGIAAQARATLQTEFRAALADGQVVPFYQPIVDLARGNVTGFEVLARWHHPSRGLLLPAAFMPMVEEQLLAADLSLCLLRHVSADAPAWPKEWTFAFNAAPNQLRELLAFVGDASRIPANMLHPKRIELELTEDAMIEDMKMARTVVRAMHASGTKVVLDDFGTGYANFMHLRDLAFDRIKIDRSFIKDMVPDPRVEACVRAMLALAQSLNVRVTAEGIETAAAATMLRDMGCDHGQGYFFSPPVPAAQVPTFAGATLLARAAA